MVTEAEKVFQSVMSDNHSNLYAALRDLSYRYAKLAEVACPGFGRWAMNDLGADPKIDVPPNPVTDDWITTGREA